MLTELVASNIYQVGVRDWHRRIFDELVPTPHGTSYNAFMVCGSKYNALIDTVDPQKTTELLARIDSIPIKSIDYIIINHAEQDHSGSLPCILKKFPAAKIVTNQKCQTFLQQLLSLPEAQWIIVKDQDKLSLGDKTLQFFMAPWVHWPETMFTYLCEDEVLFSGDLFGSHYATSDLFVHDQCAIYSAAKRYYAEIMMPFRNHIKKHITTLDRLSISVIAPTHGPIYDEPSFILDAYREWISDNVENSVVIPYISMHGSVEKMVEVLTDLLIEQGIKVFPFNLMTTDTGEFAMTLVDAATIVFATPTVLGGPHPQVAYSAYLMNILRPKTRFASMIGSYNWGGKTVDVLSGLLQQCKLELYPPVFSKGYPNTDDLGEIAALVEWIKKQHDLMIQEDE